MSTEINIISKVVVQDTGTTLTPNVKTLNFTGAVALSEVEDVVTIDVTGGTGTVTSVGLTVPSAFTVTNSPITTSGDIAINATGLASQYIRGDGQLANFPSSSGGGTTVSYYLNGATNQGTFGGDSYYQMNTVADTGVATDFTLTTGAPTVRFITDVNDPGMFDVPNGSWVFRMYFSQNNNSGNCTIQAKLYKYDGASFTLLSTGATESITNGTTVDLYTFSLPIPSGVTLLATDRLAVTLTAGNFAGSRTVTLYTQDSHLAQIQTNYAIGITAFNGLTRQTQYLATGSTGTDFNISSSTDTHTFNIPTASATNRGALSSTDWTTFNNKGDGDLKADGTVPLTADWNVGLFGITANTFTSNNDVTVNTLTIGKGPGSISGNTVIGYSALSSNTTGGNNTVLGYQAGASASTVFSLTAVGYQAGQNSTVLITAFGSQAANSNTTGLQNTALGFQTLLDNSTGTANTAVGFRALIHNTDSSNTAVGNYALRENTTGNAN